MGEPNTGVEADILTDDVVKAGIKEAEATEPSPEPTETPARPEPKETPEEFDRSASFREALQDVLQHVPEDKRKAVENRIEQAERWAATAEEAKELKARYAEWNDFAKQLQEQYQFEHGAEYLKSEGVEKYIKAALRQIAGDQKPEVEPEVEPLDESERRLKALEDKLAAQEAARQAEAESAEQAKRFAADFDPRIEKLVGKYPEDKRSEVGPLLADVAQAMWWADNMNNPDNPESVTVASSIAKVEKLIDVLVEARGAKRPTPPKPGTVQAARKASQEPQEEEDQYDILAKDFGEALDVAFQKG